MKAAIARRYGGPEVLTITEIAKPELAPNAILVRNYASVVTQAAVMMRKGTPRFARLFLGLRGPKKEIPGSAFAGKVEAVGRDVTRFAVGDDVFGETTVDFAAHAQFVAVPENGIIQPIPSNMSYEEAAPVSDGALTVHNFLVNLVTIKPGDKVLINGAAGSLGTSAVQLARHLGAEVTGVASARNEELVLGQGADHFIDYTSEDFTKAGTRYDVIFDTVGKVPYSRARRALKPDGTFLSPVLSVGLLFAMLWTSRFGSRKAKFSATGLMPHDQLREALGTLCGLIEAGAIHSVIDRRYPLNEISVAHAYVETGHKRGNVILEIGHDDRVLMPAARAEATA